MNDEHQRKGFGIIIADSLVGESPHTRYSPSRRLGEGQGRRRL